MCVQVMQTLKDLAREGCTVVCSIHQPRSSIFAMFDDLLILSEGKLLYEGSAEASLRFFEAQASVPGKLLHSRQGYTYTLLLAIYVGKPTGGQARLPVTEAYCHAGVPCP